MIEIVGKPSPCVRKVTGFYTFDRAFVNPRGDIGVPVGAGYEVIGLNHIGKSSFVYGLSGILAPPKGIVLCDFEGFDPNHLIRILEAVKFSGKLNILNKVDDEEQLSELITTLKLDEYSVGILDSIGAISPIGEQAGDLGEANWGRRAFILAQFIRKALHLLRFSDQPKTIIMINHWYPKIGSRGYNSPGGEAKKYLASVRLLLKRKEEFPDGSYVLEGKVVKNRWGYKDRLFYIFMLAGKGMHRGLTAMYDGIKLGKVKRDKNIKIGSNAIGYLKNIIAKAQEGDEQFFEPFYEILKDIKDGQTIENSSRRNKEDGEYTMEDDDNTLACAVD